MHPGPQGLPPVLGVYVERVTEPQLSMNIGKTTHRPLNSVLGSF